jgi:membrane protease subunit (stomatin/prohibitin family)
MLRAKGSPSLVSVVKNDSDALSGGDSSTTPLVWKFTQEDFNTKSQLIVNANEEALFFRDGSCVGTFTGGRYSLTTQNYPFLTALTKKFTDGVSAFNAKVYFVDCAHRLELKWGTDTPIEVMDPQFMIKTSVRARGSYSVQVTNSQKFLEKLISNNVQFFMQEELNDQFRSALSQDIRVLIKRHIDSLGPESGLMDISNQLDTIAAEMQPKLVERLGDYGVEVINFYVGAIDLPTKEEDPEWARRSEEFSSTVMAKRQMGILGEDWSRQQSVTILRDLANNPGSGGVAGAFAGAGLGMGAGNVFGEMASQMFKPQGNTNPLSNEAAAASTSQVSPFAVQANAPPPVQGIQCSCGHMNTDGAKFCAECGSVLAASVHCANCNAEVAANAKFCSECGTSRA